jgi:hypothetical protein
MSTAHAVSTTPYRIDAEEVLGWLQSGEPVTILDDRADAAYKASREHIRGDIRVDHDHFRPDPSWPRDRAAVVY